MSKNELSTQMNWRVLEPNTLRAYELAVQDFQDVTGAPIDQATSDLASAWQASMQSRGFAVNTIRQRLSALRTITGLRVELPKRQKASYALLSATQIRTLMSMVSDPANRMLLVRLLTIGSTARTVSLSDNTFMSHLLGAEREHTLASQKVTRLLKRYARNAGLNAQQVNLRVWCLSGRRLVETCTPAELASLLEARAAFGNAGKVVEYTKALHGLGRRSFAKA